MQQLTHKEEVNEPVVHVWFLWVSKIPHHVCKNVLFFINWTFKSYGQLISIKFSINIWSHHVCKKEWSDKINGILQHYLCEFNGLPWDKLQEPVFEGKICISKLESNIMENWVNCSVICQGQTNNNLGIEWFNLKINITCCDSEEIINILMCRNSKTLNCWEINLKLLTHTSIVIGKGNFDFLNI